MSNLYYVIAGLPTLKLGMSGRVPSYEDFLSSLQSLVSEDQLKRIRAFSLSANPESLDNMPELEKKFWDWEISLRNDLIKKRSSQLNVRAEDYINPIASVGIAADIAKEAFAISSPLEAEKFIDKARWEFLESLKASRSFDFEALLLYSMQLQIVLRESKFDLQKGKENYKKQYEHIIQDAQAVLMENI